jgi:hypothetical protein
MSSVQLVAFLAVGLVAAVGALVLLNPYSPVFSILSLLVIVPGWLLLLMSTSSMIVVGKDGVLIGTKFGPGEFVAYRDLLGVDRYSESSLQRNNDNNIKNQLQYAGITLHLRTKRFVKIPLRLNVGDQEPERLVNAPYELIRERLAAWRALPPTENAAPLERDGRSMNAWVSALRELGGPSGPTYRVATIDDETLLAIAEDPTKQASSRAAAAFALSAKLDDAARSRLRVSAEAIADPKLRVMIEHVIDDKPATKVEALLEEIDPLQQV